MGINVKATERNVSFEKNKEKWAYVMMPETYSTLAADRPRHAPKPTFRNRSPRMPSFFPSHATPDMERWGIFNGSENQPIIGGTNYLLY